MDKNIVNFIARAAGRAMRLLPNGKLKLRLKKGFFDRYILWREMELLTRTSFGAQVAVKFPDAIQTTIYLTGEWEPCITKLIRDALKAGDIFVDVGANIGYYSMLAATLVGDKGRVYALEASPSIYSVLSKNIERNRYSNIKSVHVAVSNAAGSCEIFKAARDNLGHSTIVRDVACTDGHTLEGVVECDVLQKLVPIEDLTRARFVKIDIEGAERLAIEGLNSVLQDFSDETEWLVELSPEFSPGGKPDVDWIFSKFLEAGYSAFLIANQYSDQFTFNDRHDAGLVEISSLPDLPLTDVLFSRRRNTVQPALH